MAAARSIMSFADFFDAIVTNVEQIIQGKHDAIRLALVCLLSEGHLLIEDVPGVGKTSLAKAMAHSLDCEWHRIQFTPDLLPSDVTGVMVFNRQSGRFEFRPGGIFANVVLGDEINRASPKTQAALLPESQLDRFLLRIRMGYPDRAAEIDMLETHGSGSAVDDLEAVVGSDDVTAMIELTKAIHVAPALKGYIVDLAASTRRHPALALGMSPRAALALQRAARALAASLGREYVIPDDIKAVGPVLEHRLAATPDAQLAGAAASDILLEAVASVPVPAGRVG
jgi:MoxR-like ATPase